MKKILILHSRRNINNVKKFHKLLIHELISEQFQCHIVETARLPLEGEQYNYNNVQSNIQQINKIISIQSEFEIYIKDLLSYDIIIAYLPIDMRSMFELGVLYGNKKKVILFFSDEHLKYNVHFLPGYCIYGKHCEVEEITKMIKEQFTENKNNSIN